MSLEKEVLGALSAIGMPATAGAVRDSLAGDPAYTTVLTILSRMLDEGLVRRERAGRRYLFSPVREDDGFPVASRRTL